MTACNFSHLPSTNANGFSARPCRHVVQALGVLVLLTASACSDDGTTEDTTTGATTGVTTGTTTASSDSDTSTSSDTGGQVACNGVFSDGTSIQVDAPVWLNDVPGTQSFCDFHTFAWNQLLWLVQPEGGVPRFMSFAPWSNLFVQSGVPSVYPGGSTALNLIDLDKSQAGDDYDLVDATNALILYDIRFNQAMYDSLLARGFYSQASYTAACNPDSSGNCQSLLWLPPDTTTTDVSVEFKSAWRSFPSGTCPATTMYCNGDLGLVGIHVVQKTATHGEWIWASFEHVGNTPDCAPGGAHPIAMLAPTGQPWAFFNPATVPASVLSSQTCDVTSNAPICNANPLVDPNCMPSQSTCQFKSVNICRTDQLPSGGASSANCAIGGSTQDSANNAGNVACLNATLAPQLGGPWQNYELIGTLWTKGTLAPTQDFRIQEFQSMVVGLPYVEPVGFPNLANTTMETWLQFGSTGFQPFGSGYTPGCFSCHNPPSKTFEIDLSHSIAKIREP